MDLDEKELEAEERGRHCIAEKSLFFIGFLFPLAWFIGSSDCSCRPHKEHVFVWKKRCRIAATLFLTAVIVLAAVVMIVNPAMFGLRTSTSGPQTQSSSDTAIRPGVPVNGSSSWGDAVAGTVVE